MCYLATSLLFDMAAAAWEDDDPDGEVQRAIALSLSDNQDGLFNPAVDTERAEQLMGIIAIATIEEQGNLLKKFETNKPINSKEVNSKPEESNIKDNAVELSGLPWTATEEEIRKFLKDCKIVKILIILNDYSKPSGNAKVWFSSKDDLNRALLCDKNNIGRRYVYVRKADDVPEIEDEREETRGVQLKELPWTATRQQICDFLFGCEVVGGQAGVHIEMNESGKPSGSALVYLRTKTDVENALNFHKQKLGKRNVDVVRLTTKAEKSRKEEIIIKLSGLARKVTVSDISDFLSGGNVKHVEIVRTKDDKGKPSGDAFVSIESEESLNVALSLHETAMGNRRIDVCHVKKEEFEKAKKHKMDVPGENKA